MLFQARPPRPSGREQSDSIRRTFGRAESHVFPFRGMAASMALLT